MTTTPGSPVPAASPNTAGGPFFVSSPGSFLASAWGLNRVIRGWGAYFRQFNSTRAFKKADYYVWQKLTRWMRLKHQSRTRVLHTSPSALYRSEGLVTLRGTVQYAR